MGNTFIQSILLNHKYRNFDTYDNVMSVHQQSVFKNSSHIGTRKAFIHEKANQTDLQQYLRS